MSERAGQVQGLRVYQSAMQSAMQIFEITRAFPREERYSLTDQIRRSSRSVCVNLAEAWQKRRYPAHFVSKLNDCASEAQETRVWLEFTMRCHYLEQTAGLALDNEYDTIIAQLVTMMNAPEKWTF